MQTFLPHPDFERSAAVLDFRRLGKQRIEAKQILQALKKMSEGVRPGGWASHPAVLMWEGHEHALCEYGIAMCSEWIRIGYRDTTLAFFVEEARSMTGWPASRFTRPPWLGDEDFHASHRSNLLRKNPEFYSRYQWMEADDLPYVWPVSKKQENESRKSTV